MNNRLLLDAQCQRTIKHNSIFSYNFFNTFCYFFQSVNWFNDEMFFSILHYRYRLPTSNVIGYIFLYLFLSLFLVSLRFFPAPLQRRSSVYIIPYEMSYPHLPFFSYKLFIFHPDILYSFTKHHFRAKNF